LYVGYVDMNTMSYYYVITVGGGVRVVMLGILADIWVFEVVIIMVAVVVVVVVVITIRVAVFCCIVLVLLLAFLLLLLLISYVML